MKFIHKKNAFTLLEMLIVIGIMGVLIAFAVSSYSTAQKKARDAKRKADLTAARNVMEQCYSGSATYVYPVVSASSGTLSGSCTVNAVTYTFSITDPLNTGTNIYTIQASTTSTYTLRTVLETNATPFEVTSQQ